MRAPTAARLFHGGTFAVVAFGLIAQLVLVIIGVSVLTEENPPGVFERLFRFVSYFTVQANVLVALSAFTLLREPDRDGSAWRWLRLAGLVGITVTAVVHWIFLRPLLNLDGWAYWCDKALHVVVPLLAVLGWLIFGPRPRVGRLVALLVLIWPASWLVLTLARGAVTGWYPYPFLDFGRLGPAPVLAAALGVTALICLTALLFGLGDRRLPAAHSGNGRRSGPA